MAAGLAIAGGIIFGIGQLMKGGGAEPKIVRDIHGKQLTDIHGNPLPSMQHGGIVPGPLGQPVPVMAHGGEAFAGVGGRLGNTINLNVEGSVVTEHDLLDFIKRGLLLDETRSGAIFEGR